MTTRQFLCGCLLMLTSATAFADGDDTLVRKQGGTFVPAMAKSWQATSPTTITLTLDPSCDPVATAQLLNDRIANIKATAAGNVITVDGMALNPLLEHLASLHLKAEADPLSDLGGLGGTVVASRAPEGGGSIRAHKDTPIPPGLLPADANTVSAPSANAAKAAPTVQANERLEVEVVKVDRGTFPTVTLQLKVRRVPQKSPLAKSFKAGTTFSGTVAFASGPAGVDLQNAANVHNLVAYYLAAGDKIVVHPTAAPTGDGNVAALDWLERPGVTVP